MPLGIAKGFIQSSRNALAADLSGWHHNCRRSSLRFQAGHEIDKNGSRHDFSIRHLSDFAVVGDRRNHVEAASFGSESNYRRSSLWCESLGIHFAIDITIFPLGDDLRVHSGHLPASTIEHQRKSNSFFQYQAGKFINNE